MRALTARPRSLAPVTAVVAVLLTFVVITAASPPQTAGGAPTGGQPTEVVKGTGFLLGQVIDSSTSQPLAGAIVNLSSGAVTTTVLPTGEVAIAGPAPAGTSQAPRQILTDSAGRYMFRELTKGRYTIRATAPGYLTSTFGQSSSSAPAQTIELTTDDEKRGNLTIRMWRTATVSGRLTDETGEPVVGHQVRVFRRTSTAGRLRYLPGGSPATTDDRGMFRVSSLAPGEYVVGVLSTQTTMPAATADAYYQQMMSGTSPTSTDWYRELTSSNAPSPMAGGHRVGDLILQATPSYMASGAATPAPADNGVILTYPPVFYPGARVVSDASVMTLASGEDRPGVDIQLKLVPTVRLSGTVVGPDGPVRNLGLRLLPAGSEEFSSDGALDVAATATDATGAFTFLGVVPGAYTLRALRVPRPPPSAGPTAGSTSIEIVGPNGAMMGIMSGGPSVTAVLPTEPTLWASMPIIVSDANLTGLTLAVRTGARLSGRIVFDGTRPAPPPEVVQRASISIGPMAGTNTIGILTAAKRVESDGRFSTVGYPPGRYSLSASIPPPPGDPTRWRFRSATLGGRDVSDEGLDVQGEDISGLTIVLTDRSTELTGTVTNAKGQPDTTATVVAFPADSQGWKQGLTSARRSRTVRVSTVGAFSMPDLPPGDYFIAALVDVSMDSWQTPKTMDAISRVATRITVLDGGKVTQDLRTVTVR
jgi:protocatechuate 3,4-dioxygenase beta subunit